MNTGIRIIKRSLVEVPESSPLIQNEKTTQVNERDIAITVKNWIAELAQRRLVDEHNARRFFAAMN